MLRGLVVCSMVLLVTACQPHAPTPVLPGQTPVSPAPTSVPTPSPTGSPSLPAAIPSTAAPLPSPSGTPAAVPQACLTPPPDDCCDIVYGALHGTIVDEDGQVLSTAHVTLRSVGQYLLGGCSDTEAVAVTDGHFAFNAVPFDVPLLLTAAVDGYAPFRAATLVSKGPVMEVVVRMKRDGGG